MTRIDVQRDILNELTFTGYLKHAQVNTKRSSTAQLYDFELDLSSKSSTMLLKTLKIQYGNK